MSNIMLVIAPAIEKLNLFCKTLEQCACRPQTLQQKQLSLELVGPKKKLKEIQPGK